MFRSRANSAKVEDFGGRDLLRDARQIADPVNRAEQLIEAEEAERSTVR